MSAAFPISSNWEKWKHTNKQKNPRKPKQTQPPSKKTSEAWVHEMDKNKFSFYPKINTYHWLCFILVIMPCSLESIANPMRVFCLILKCHCFSVWHLKTNYAALLHKWQCDWTASSVHLSKCSLFSFWGQLWAIQVLTMQATFTGEKSFAWTKFLGFCFLFLVLVYAVLHRKPFLPGVTEKKKAEINSRTDLESLSQQGSGEIREAEC